LTEVVTSEALLLRFGSLDDVDTVAVLEICVIPGGLLSL
jgi:hypothetical protein